MVVDPSRPRRRLLVRALLGGGSLLALFGLTADLFGIGHRGMGTQEAALIVVGVAAIVLGVLLSPSLRTRIAELFARREVERTPPKHVMLFCLAAGLLAGALESIGWLFQSFVLDATMRGGLHSLWMGPVTTVVGMQVVGLCVVITGAVWPRLGSLRCAACALGLVWVWSLLFEVSGLQSAAQVLVALGAAVVAGRAVAGRSSGVVRLARRVSLALGPLVIAAVGVIHGLEWGAHRSALAALPTPRLNAPNVVLIVLDTVRAKSLSTYGYERETAPRLTELARTGVVFEYAESTSPWTLPSHGTMFTGRYPHELNATWDTALNAEHATLAEALSGRGFETAGFVGNTIYGGREFGLGRGFSYYRDYAVSLRNAALSSELGYAVMRHIAPHTASVRNDAETVTGWFGDWLDQRADRPFFAFLNYFDAHALYLPPEGWAGRFGPESDVVYRGLWHQFEANEIEELRDAYDACVAYVDDHVGRVVAELARRGLRENTLVIVTGDHGEQFGEHGLTDHANSLYRPLLHMPLVISLPGRLPAGAHVATPVSLRDLPATILDVVDVSSSSAGPSGSQPAPTQSRLTLPGVSLRGAWTEQDPVVSPLLASVHQGVRTPGWFPATTGPMHSLTAAGYHLIRRADGTAEMYDTATDPEELIDLLAATNGHPDAQELLAELTRLLEDVR